MFRMLVIACLLFAAPVQGFARGGLDVSADMTPGESAVQLTTLEMVGVDTVIVDAVLTAPAEPCCEEAALAENSERSACKSDCKAVISPNQLTRKPAIHEHMETVFTRDTSLASPVDLRPPIA
ncbi:MAG: hypothetical protein AAF638_02545 [Pseudomonadota bacterium]